MKVLAQFVVVFLLQIELFSAMRISHKKVLKDSKDSSKYEHHSCTINSTCMHKCK